jgi:CHASE2 domain-containing sensor protein
VATEGRTQGREEATPAQHWLTGLIFGFLLSACVVLASYAPGVGSVLRVVETGGIDAAMNVRRVLTPAALVGEELRTLPAGYVFVDLDASLCKDIEHSAWCDTRSPASPIAAVRAAAAAIDAGARVVVIDVRLWDAGPNGLAGDKDFKTLVAALAAHPQARAVAAAPSRPTSVAGLDRLESSMIPLSLLAGGVRFAPAYAYANSGVIRGYPVAIRVQPSDAAARGTVFAPSLPYLAARYQRAGGDVGRLAQVDGLARSFAPTARELAFDGRDVRPLFTLASLATSSGPTDAAEVRGLYDHYFASKVIASDGTLLISPDLLRDKVVVIGASARVGMDWHFTPIGPMSGAEVVLNMTRAFASGAVLVEPDLLGKILRECLFVFVGSLAFLLYWWVSDAARPWAFRLGESLARRLPRSTHAHILEPIAHAFAVAPAVLLFLPTVAASAVLIIAAAFSLVDIAFIGGRTWDLITPLFALSLEGFAHASMVVLGLIEAAVAGAPELGRRRPAHEVRMPNSNEGRLP